jgi:hypothetical protein
VVAQSPATLAGVTHAELVALRVGHQDPRAAVLRQLLVAQPDRAQPFEPLRLRLDLGRFDVDVHAVLGGLGFWNPLQQQFGLPGRRRDQQHVVAGATKGFVTEGGSTVLAALAAEPSALLAIDIEPQPLAALEEFIVARDLGARVHTRYGIDQGDRDQLARTVDEAIGTEPLDLVIDDASHALDLTRTSFEVLFPRLAPGGLYAIEDWNADHIFRESMIEHFRTASADERAEVARLLRETATISPMPGPPDRRPLLDLAVELVLARARAAEDAIAEVVVNRYWLMVRRGPAALDGTTFRLADVVHDHFGYVR